MVKREPACWMLMSRERTGGREGGGREGGEEGREGDEKEEEMTKRRRNNLSH